MALARSPRSYSIQLVANEILKMKKQAALAVSAFTTKMHARPAPTSYNI